MWKLIFAFFNIMNILGLIYPFLIKVDLRFNLLKLKGIASIMVFNKIKLEIKLRIKNGYLYVYFNNKERKEKISKKNINLVFIVNLIKQMYFRQQWLNFTANANFGYTLDSCVTATGCGYFDVLVKSLLGKIKNNKKTAHIFINVEPKYNQDICSVRLINEVRMSFFDIVYSLLYAIIYTRRNNEKNRNYSIKQRKKG